MEVNDDDYIEQLIANQRLELQALQPILFQEPQQPFEYSPEIQHKANDEERLVKEWQRQWELRRQQVKETHNIDYVGTKSSSSTSDGTELDSPFKSLRTDENDEQVERVSQSESKSTFSSYEERHLRDELQEEKAKRIGAEAALSEVLDELDIQRRAIAQAEKEKKIEMVARRNELSIQDQLRSELGNKTSEFDDYANRLSNLEKECLTLKGRLEAEQRGRHQDRTQYKVENKTTAEKYESRLELERRKHWEQLDEAMKKAQECDQMREHAEKEVNKLKQMLRDSQTAVSRRKAELEKEAELQSKAQAAEVKALAGKITLELQAFRDAEMEEAARETERNLALKAQEEMSQKLRHTRENALKRASTLMYQAQGGGESVSPTESVVALEELVSRQDAAIASLMRTQPTPQPRPHPQDRVLLDPEVMSHLRRRWAELSYGAEGERWAHALRQGSAHGRLGLEQANALFSLLNVDRSVLDALLPWLDGDTNGSISSNALFSFLEGPTDIQPQEAFLHPQSHLPPPAPPPPPAFAHTPHSYFYQSAPLPSTKPPLSVHLPLSGASFAVRPPLNFRASSLRYSDDISRESPVDFGEGIENQFHEDQIRSQEITNRQTASANEIKTQKISKPKVGGGVVKRKSRSVRVEVPSIKSVATSSSPKVEDREVNLSSSFHGLQNKEGKKIGGSVHIKQSPRSSSSVASGSVNSRTGRTTRRSSKGKDVGVDKEKVRLNSRAKGWR